MMPKTMVEEVKRGAFTTPFRMPFGKVKGEGGSKEDSFRSMGEAGAREEGDDEAEGGDDKVKGDVKRDKKHRREKSGGGHVLSKLMQVSGPLASVGAHQYMRRMCKFMYSSPCN